MTIHTDANSNSKFKIWPNIRFCIKIALDSKIQILLSSVSVRYNSVIYSTEILISTLSYVHDNQNDAQLFFIV